MKDYFRYYYAESGLETCQYAKYQQAGSISPKDYFKYIKFRN